MTQVRIYLLISVRDLILVVFYYDALAWQFRIISGSAVFGRKLYKSAEAAAKAGRQWIGAVS